MKRASILGKYAIKQLLQLGTRIYFTLHKKTRFTEPKRIAILHTKPLGLGDLIMATPGMRAIRARFPKSKITLITSSSLLQGSKIIDNLVIYTPNKRRLFIAEHRNRYDLILLPSKAINMTLLALALSPKLLAGYLYDWTLRSTFSTRTTKSFFRYKELCIHLAEYLGGSCTHTAYEQVPLSTGEKKKVDAYIKKNKLNKFMVINPNSMWESKDWGVENFISLCTTLTKHIPVVLISGPLEKRKTRQIKKAVPETHDAGGMFNMRESAYLAKKSKAFITGDTGPMHAALSLNAPTIALFGSTDERRFFEKSPHAIALHPDRAQYPACYNLEHEPLSNCGGIQTIPPSKVLSTIQRVEVHV